MLLQAALLLTGGVRAQSSGPTIGGSVYGGGALANTGNTTVNLTGGTVTGDVYGGGMGSAEVSATVGDALVELNKGVADDARGCVIGGSIFGCNNVNGTPTGTDTVHIYKTQNAAATRISNPAEGEKTAKVKNRYDVLAVYGGGNQAAYVPTKASGTEEEKKAAHTTVIIDGCDLTSIRTVYGGGDAASTPATEITVNGTFEIEELFGGGNGADKLPDGSDNPGANVGYSAYSTDYDPPASSKEERTSLFGYGSGKASVNIYGGLIHRVFGGSNTKGNVRETALTLLDDMESCHFHIDEAYGGGKSAPMDANAILLMSCIPGLQNVYGGAQAADIHGDVTLNITNGTFDRVFGGNNISGTIKGAIKVNVNEIGCKPVIIGELYGGGNQAAYSVYGYETDGTPKTSGASRQTDPQVNVHSFTSIGAIYGGGYGSGAKMVGDPTVNINVVKGRYRTTAISEGARVVGAAVKKPGDDDYDASAGYEIPAHAAGEIGVIGTVFGGGNAAQVIGSPTVHIGTEAGDEIYEEAFVKTGDDVTGLFTRSGEGTEESPYEYSAATGTAVAETPYYEKKTVSANIVGNVYGGGNNAEVTGDTDVVIGKKKSTSAP